MSRVGAMGKRPFKELSKLLFFPAAPLGGVAAL